MPDVNELDAFAENEAADRRRYGEGRSEVIV
jgi:hypothetical protein